MKQKEKWARDWSYTQCTDNFSEIEDAFLAGFEFAKKKLMDMSENQCWAGKVLDIHDIYNLGEEETTK